MDKLISNFTNQLSEAIEIGQNAKLTPPEFPIQNIMVSGLGGSGIGGNLVSEFVANELEVPFAVNKDYSIPYYVSEKTLFIASSYSGNTEETLSALQQAIDRKCKIVCVSSNGKVVELAKQHGFDHIMIPGGMPPRSCLGYSFVQQLYVLSKLGLISDAFEDWLKAAIHLLKNETESIKNEAKGIADQLNGTLPIIYISAHMESVGVRFRQQVNENSKMLCWHHVIPEMNHNELVGWRTNDEKLAVVILRNDDDLRKIQDRIEINKTIFEEYTPNIQEIWSKGESHIERALYLIHLCDWVSFYLAEIRGMDAVEVKVIDYLKGELAKS